MKKVHGITNIYIYIVQNYFDRLQTLFALYMFHSDKKVQIMQIFVTVANIEINDEKNSTEITPIISMTMK